MATLNYIPELLASAVLVAIVLVNINFSRRKAEWHMHKPWIGPPVMRRKVDGQWITRAPTDAELSDWGYGATGW